MPAAASLRNSCASAAVSAGFEPRGRLVEHQHPRPKGERARDLEQPLVDVRQLAGQSTDAPAIADEAAGVQPSRAASRVLRRRENDAATQLAALHRDQRGCRARSSGRRAGGVWNVRAMPARAIWWAGCPRRFRRQGGRTPVRPVEAADQVEHRRLAGAVGTDDAGHWPGSACEPTDREPPARRRMRCRGRSTSSVCRAAPVDRSNCADTGAAGTSISFAGVRSARKSAGDAAGREPAARRAAGCRRTARDTGRDPTAIPGCRRR